LVVAFRRVPEALAFAIAHRPGKLAPYRDRNLTIDVLSELDPEQLARLLLDAIENGEALRRTLRIVNPLRRVCWEAAVEIDAEIKRAKRYIASRATILRGNVLQFPIERPCSPCGLVLVG
jgi:hypothetical protein